MFWGFKLLYSQHYERPLRGVFRLGFNTRTSGVIISLDSLIPTDLLWFTAAKIWPPLFVR